MFNKTYELTLNKNYVMNWGLLEAIRELIQNAIDSESPFEYEFVSNEEGETSLVLSSRFTMLSPTTLLLGSTTKAGDSESIGSFGEGYKIAMLVLTRLGNKVKIFNGNKLWEPDFKYNKKFNDDLLVVYESDLTKENEGLAIQVFGLSAEDIESIKDSCLHMQKSKGEIKSTQYGDILLDKPGQIFVGGLFVFKSSMKYGYDIKPQYIRLERDRQTVNGWALGCLTRDMWFNTKDFDQVASMIEQKFPDVEYAEYNSPEMVKDACYKLFKQQHPGAVAASDQRELKELIAKGMERVVVVNSSVMYENVTKSHLYRNEKQVAVESIHDYLTRWLAENKYHMHFKVVNSFKNIIEMSKNWSRL